VDYQAVSTSTDCKRETILKLKRWSSYAKPACPAYRQAGLRRINVDEID
jgi:hypothetical protein